MKPSRFAVIGAGLAGAATAWRLTQRGHDVTAIERSTPANHGGSSHGSARIFRYAYPDPFYAELVKRSRAGWDELEQLSGRTFITPSGAIDFGLLRDPQGLARVLDEIGVANELMAADIARERWPQFAFDTPVLWHEAAGVIDAESSVHAMMRLAEAAGAEVRLDWPVQRVENRPGGYRIHSASGEVIEAEHVIVSAGGWLPELLGALELPSDFIRALPSFEVRQEQAFHFPYADGVTDSDAAAVWDSTTTAWPTFIYKAAPIQVYGLPGGRDAGFRGQKVAEFNGGKVLPSASAQDGLIEPANRERVIAFVKQFLPGLVPEPYEETSCLFTNTPNEDFVIDKSGSLTILSPCSGHGAKFAPLLGEFAADLATGEREIPHRFRATGLRRPEFAPVNG